MKKDKEEYFRKKANAIKLHAEVQARQSGELVRQQTAALIMARKEMAMMKRIFAYLVAREPGQMIVITDDELMAISPGSTVRMVRAKDKNETVLVFLEAKKNVEATGEAPVPGSEAPVHGDPLPESGVRTDAPESVPDVTAGVKWDGRVPGVSEVREENSDEGSGPKA